MENLKNLQQPIESLLHPLLLAVSFFSLFYGWPRFKKRSKNPSDVVKTLPESSALAWPGFLQARVL